MGLVKSVAIAALVVLAFSAEPLRAESLVVNVGEDITLSNDAAYDDIKVNGILRIGNGKHVTCASLVVATNISGQAEFRIGDNASLISSGDVTLGVDGGYARVVMGDNSLMRAPNYHLCKADPSAPKKASDATQILVGAGGVVETSLAEGGEMWLNEGYGDNALVSGSLANFVGTRITLYQDAELRVSSFIVNGMPRAEIAFSGGRVNQTTASKRHGLFWLAGAHWTKNPITRIIFTAKGGNDIRIRRGAHCDSFLYRDADPGLFYFQNDGTSANIVFECDYVETAACIRDYNFLFYDLRKKPLTDALWLYHGGEIQFKGTGTFPRLANEYDGSGANTSNMLPAATVLKIGNESPENNRGLDLNGVPEISVARIYGGGSVTNSSSNVSKLTIADSAAATLDSISGEIDLVCAGTSSLTLSGELGVKSLELANTDASIDAAVFNPRASGTLALKGYASYGSPQFFPVKIAALHGRGNFGTWTARDENGAIDRKPQILMDPSGDCRLAFGERYIAPGVDVDLAASPETAVVIGDPSLETCDYGAITVNGSLTVRSGSVVTCTSLNVGTNPLEQASFSLGEGACCKVSSPAYFGRRGGYATLVLDANALLQTQGDCYFTYADTPSDYPRGTTAVFLREKACIHATGVQDAALFMNCGYGSIDVPAKGKMLGTEFTLDSGARLSAAAFYCFGFPYVQVNFNGGSIDQRDWNTARGGTIYMAGHWQHGNCGGKVTLNSVNGNDILIRRGSHANSVIYRGGDKCELITQGTGDLVFQCDSSEDTATASWNYLVYDSRHDPVSWLKLNHVGKIRITGTGARPKLIKDLELYAAGYADNLLPATTKLKVDADPVGNVALHEFDLCGYPVLTFAGLAGSGTVSNSHTTVSKVTVTGASQVGAVTGNIALEVASGEFRVDRDLAVSELGLGADASVSCGTFRASEGGTLRLAALPQDQPAVLPVVYGAIVDGDNLKGWSLYSNGVIQGAPGAAVPHIRAKDGHLQLGSSGAFVIIR